MKILHNRVLLLACIAGSFDVCSMQPPLKKQKCVDTSSVVVARPTSQAVLLDASLGSHRKTYFQRKAEIELIARCSVQLPREVQEKIAQYVLAGNPVLLKMISQIAVPTQEIKAHKKAVFDVVFSNDGKIFATSSLSGFIKLWDARTGARSRSLGRQSSPVAQIAFNNNSTVLFSAGNDKKVRFWDIATGNCTQELQSFSATNLSIAVSRNSNDYIAVGHSTVVDIFDQQGKHLFRLPVTDPAVSLPSSDHFIQDMQFTPDDTELYVASCGTVHVIDIATRRYDRSCMLLPNQTVWKIDISDDQLLVSFSKGALGVWDLQTQNLLRLYQSNANRTVSNGVRYPKNNLLISTTATRADGFPICADKTAMLWSVYHGDRIWGSSDHNESPVWALAVDADANKIATGAGDGKVIIRDITPVLHVDQEIKRLTIDQASLILAATKKFGIPRLSTQDTFLNGSSSIISLTPYLVDDTMMPAYRLLSPELQKQLLPLLDMRRVFNSNSNNNATQN